MTPIKNYLENKTEKLTKGIIRNYLENKTDKLTKSLIRNYLENKEKLTKSIKFIRNVVPYDSYKPQKE